MNFFDWLTIAFIFAKWTDHLQDQSWGWLFILVPAAMLGNAPTRVKIEK